MNQPLRLEAITDIPLIAIAATLEGGRISDKSSTVDTVVICLPNGTACSHKREGLQMGRLTH